MVGADGADIPVLEQVHRVDIHRRHLRHGNSEIDFLAVELFRHAPDVGRNNGKPDVRRLTVDELHQRGEECRLGVVGRGDGEDGIGRVRIELGQRQDGIDILQYGLYRADQFKRLRGRPDPLLRSHEKGIVKRVPQSFQRAADRRLGQVQAPGGAADTALVEQDVEHNQKIQVYVSNIRQNDNSYKT